MIQMLSRFDLKPDIATADFQASYAAFIALLVSEGLIENSGQVCRRLSNTPMDTDAEDAPEFYTIMTFRDRSQLDAAYTRFKKSMAGHEAVFTSVCNSTFTCWEEL